MEKESIFRDLIGTSEKGKILELFIVYCDLDLDYQYVSEQTGVELEKTKAIVNYLYVHHGVLEATRTFKGSGMYRLNKEGRIGKALLELFNAAISSQAAKDLEKAN